jgi:hypothetical protein
MNRLNRVFKDFDWISISMMMVVALVMIIPETGYCGVAPIDKMTQKIKELTESLSKLLLGLFGLYVVGAGIMAWRAPDAFGQHMYKIGVMGVVVMISYMATEVVNFFVK